MYRYGAHLAEKGLLWCSCLQSYNLWTFCCNGESGVNQEIRRL